MKSFALSFLLASALFVTAQPDSGSAASGDPVVSVQSGEWMTPSTWDCNCVPALGNEVSILNGHSIVLAEGDTAQAEGLSVSEGAVLDLPRESRLELISSLVSLGAINGRGIVALVGEDAKVVGPATLEHLSCGMGAVTILDTLVIQSQLDIEDATFNTNGKLVLKDVSGIRINSGSIAGSMVRDVSWEKTSPFTFQVGAGLSGTTAAEWLELPGAVYLKKWLEPNTSYATLLPTDEVEVGVGYTCSLPPGSYHQQMSGVPVTEFEMELTADATSSWSGWNVASNPLTGFVDLTMVESAVEGSFGAIYTWVDSLQTYVAQIGSSGNFGRKGILAPAETFWCILDTGTTLHFDAQSLVEKKEWEDQFSTESLTLLGLQLQAEERLEQCTIDFGGTNPAFDESEDAPFVPSAFRGRNQLDIFTKSSDEVSLVINKTNSDAQIIPLWVKALNGDSVTLTSTDVPDNLCLSIEDVLTGWTGIVDENLSYTYLASSHIDEHRFNLILGGGIEANSTDAACASAMNGSITVMGPDEASTFTLVDAEGNAAGTFSPDSSGGTFTDLAVGTYTVTAVSDGCADLERTIEVGAGGSGIAPFAIDAMPDHIGCYDDHGGVTLEVEGGLEPYSVIWSHGGAGLTIEVEEAGVLHAVVTDAAGCSDSTTVEVLAAPQVAAGIDLDDPVVALIDGEAEVHFENASTGATGYQWNFGDGGTSTTENPIHAYTAAGAYTVGLNAWNDYCSDTYQMVVTVETVSSVGDFISAIEPSIHRTAQGWEVAHPQEAFHVEVFDLTGRIVHQAQGMTGQPVLLDPAVMPTVSLVHWVGALTGQQKTWRVAH